MKQTVVYEKGSPYTSPWSTKDRVKQLLWQICWTLLCRWTPKPLYPWRVWWLKRFGASIHGHVFVHQRARIQIPWLLIMHDRASLGDGSVAYSVGPIEIGARATVAQEAYLAAGSHDFNSPTLPMTTAPITIGADAFIGTRAFVHSGVEIGEGCVIGSMSAVTKSTQPWTIYAGNPATKVADRKRC